MTMAGEAPLLYEEFVPIPMRDGTLLAASVTRPAGDGPFPTVLTRTPYDRTNQRANGVAWANAGYAFVRQDVRGRFDSAGEFWPFRDDPADGYDTIEWIAEQPWSDGRVGTTGASHVGTVQYLLAPTRPPHLTAAIPEFAPVSVYDRWWYHGGAFRIGFNLAWITMLSVDNLRHFPERTARLMEAREQLWVTPSAMRAQEPLALFREWTPLEYPVSEGVFGNDWYQQFMARPTRDAFWDHVDFRTQHAEMDTPMLHVGGWYDTFCQGTIDSFTGLREHARTPEARAGQRLIMGPWRHVNWGEQTVGEMDYGPALLEVNPFETRRRFFDHHLRGLENGTERDKPVMVFTMGENAWHGYDAWPLSTAAETPYYLQPGGGLSPVPAGSEERVSFRYDPNDPVPTLGGCEWVNFPCGPFEHAPLDGRSDVLHFQTEPLESAVEVTGQVFARLRVASSAVDTDFTAKLLDVHPDGRAYNLCDGIVRARYRDGFERETPLTPGEPVELEVDLWSTSNLFQAGHRIRLDISSSNFPRFAPNANTGEAPFSFRPGEERRVVAENTVFVGGGHGSCVVLPVIPRT
ncbi:MAG: CocE/NonD family hydrolase [Chloroflexi bacterium]|nr:CocE/NonD family hydrolase [Chloroflexota bacterium]MDA1003852.1 CocE/NonD family hydrolase [Chloroflexota bacterium]